MYWSAFFAHISTFRRIFKQGLLRTGFGKWGIDKRIVTMNRKKQLANMILALKSDDKNQKSLEIPGDFINSIDCIEMAHAQMQLLDSGMDIGELYNIWQKNKRLLPDVVAKLKLELPENHILIKIFIEHEMLLCFLCDFEEANKKIQGFTYASSSNSEIRKLEHISRHLSAAEEHCQREEQVIFPQLKAKGFSASSKLINIQHEQLKVRIDQLRQLVWSIEEISFYDFKKVLQQLIGYIVPVMRHHIFIENNLIFPLALEVIDDPSVWAKIKDICDDIGYCAYPDR